MSSLVVSGIIFPPKLFICTLQEKNIPVCHGPLQLLIVYLQYTSNYMPAAVIHLQMAFH